MPPRRIREKVMRAATVGARHCLARGATHAAIRHLVSRSNPTGAALPGVRPACLGWKDGICHLDYFEPVNEVEWGAEAQIVSLPQYWGRAGERARSCSEALPRAGQVRDC